MAVLIKRYQNRKLYDTRSKAYITLENIADVIRAGEEIRVIDFSTGKDLTALTLTQIILGQEKRQSGSIPMPLLSGLVKAGQEALHSLLIGTDQSTSLFDQIVSRTLIQYGLPTREDYQKLLSQLDYLSQQVEELSSRKNPKA